VKDLTVGSIPKHIIEMAVPMGVGMLVQTLYYLVDLYFVGDLGDVALAGVSAGGNAMFLIIALTQILGVGAVALISHATGRKDQEDANLVFNQSLLLAALLGLATITGGYALVRPYLMAIAADDATIRAGTTYLFWFIPGMALQFAMVAMGSALRGTGIVKPTMVVQMATVVLNIVLAPILIAGWGTGIALGVAGAGLASSVSVAAGTVMLWFYFHRLEHYVAFNRAMWRPRFSVWKRMLGIGFPAGGEFLLMFFFMAVIYWTIRDFGSSAQAGFGVGSRIMQSIFLPAMAVAFAAPAVAGQNFGAQSAARVRETFRWTATMTVAVMAVLTMLCQWQPRFFVQAFSDDMEVIAIAATFLKIISWNFVPAALVFTCSGMFQALGNTWPALLSMATRLITFAVPAIWLSTRSNFQIEQIWLVSAATVALQAVLSLALMRREFRLRLAF
jgi:putative MATE family efflux protein